MQTIKLSARFLIVLLIIFCAQVQIASAQTATSTTPNAGVTITHIVQPGDTWIALAWQYGLDATQLKQSYGHMNQQRQPTIGSTLLLPDTGIIRNGLIVRPVESVMKTAVSHNITPWTITQRNNLTTPYQSLLYAPIFIPINNQPVREFPIGFEQLELSQIPAKPGQAIGLRGIVQPDQQISASLSGVEMDLFGNGRYLIALTGTGAFFGAGEPELTMQIDGKPLWTQPWRFEDDEWNFQQRNYTKSPAS